MAKRVAVIGAAASGLPAIKCCLEEDLEPVCFERTNNVGGLWRFTDDVTEGQACVMKSTVINTSKEMMAYSDFPIPKEFPNFMHNTKVLEYFHMYADHFQLTKYIRFKTEVMWVAKSTDFASSGKWDLRVKNLATGVVTMETFDAVLVCTGHHAFKYMPEFPGLEDFQGKVLHSQEYKDQKGYEGKRVVIVGIGNSGGDMSVELGRCCEQVFLSTRRGAWVLNRVGEYGEPADMVLGRRFSMKILRMLPLGVLNSMVEKKLNARFDHSLYGLKPKHRFLSQHPMVNDDLPNRIACGDVKIKPNVRKITKTGVEFEDGSFEDNIDVIVLATGYVFGFPFIDKDVIEVKKNVVNLYKLVHPPDLEQPTLAVIGCIQPWGAIMPISEMQCRWATRVFKGLAQLPPASKMTEHIAKERAAMDARYFRTQRHTIQVDYIPYMDELAVEVGCKPNIGELFLRDPKLAFHCLFGPCTPAQFRLMGPHPWDGAKKTIETTRERVVYPLHSGVATESSSSAGGTSALLISVIVLVILAILLHWLFF